MMEKILKTCVLSIRYLIEEVGKKFQIIYFCKMRYSMQKRSFHLSWDKQNLVTLRRCTRSHESLAEELFSDHSICSVLFLDKQWVQLRVAGLGVEVHSFNAEEGLEFDAGGKEELQLKDPVENIRR